jgi:putative radical SAM enzyme (TIGR03279 family)
MHISPVNVSVHTTNPELRVRMMKNPQAGEALRHLYRMAEHGTKLNCQLVLCPGYNDGEELSRSLADLGALYPAVQSVAAVPVGITRYREGLAPLSPFTKEQAADVVARMESFGEEFLSQHGTRLCYPADEFYLKAEKPLPCGEFYEEYAQIENGVGMWTSFKEEFLSALAEEPARPVNRTLSLVTGMAALPLIQECCRLAQEQFQGLTCHVYGIRNEFFGEHITVTGLLTGKDIIAQLQGKPLGDTLLLPSATLRREGDLLLDDTTPEQIGEALGVPVAITDGDGFSLLENLLG